MGVLLVSDVADGPSIVAELEKRVVLVLPWNPVDIQASRSKVNVTDASFRFCLISGLSEAN